METEVATARMIATATATRHILMLCKMGIPFDVAVSWSDAERMGWYVAACEIEAGGASRFDWDEMRWKETKGG